MWARIDQMLRKEKYGGRGKGPRRTVACLLLPALLVIVTLTPFNGARAATAQNTSGTIHLSNSLDYGNTAYSVDYSYPSTAEVGTNLTIAVNLHTISLTGLIEYVNNFRLVAFVYIGPQIVLNGSIDSGSQPLYQRSGATWGPSNIIVPLTDRNTGVSVGESANATVSITLSDTLWVGGPAISQYRTEPAMQGDAGALVIQNGVTSSGSQPAQDTAQTYLPYALVASGAVLMLLTVFFLRGPRSSRENQK
jgi:hypothetical protein